MPFFQHEDTGICVQTFFGNKPPSRRFYEITEKQYKIWSANQATSNNKPKTRHYAYLAEITNGQQTIQVDANHVGEMYTKQTVQCVILTKEITLLTVIKCQVDLMQGEAMVQHDEKRLWWRYH